MHQHAPESLAIIEWEHWLKEQVVLCNDSVNSAGRGRNFAGLQLCGLWWLVLGS